MCGICGCGKTSDGNGHEHEHERGHDGHDHGHHPHKHVDTGRRVAVEQELLAHNDLHAAANREWLSAREVVALNLIGAPGAGKTALLEATIARLGGELPLAVIEGDQETDRDAERIRARGCPVRQINTGTGCHLDAATVGDALQALAPARGAVVLIENVGNLVCPALFDLGERARVVLLSATEGEDKPLKYPHVFRGADLILLTKTDLLPHLDFDLARCRELARRVNTHAPILPVSPRKGEGLDAWFDWLQDQLSLERHRAVHP